MTTLREAVQQFVADYDCGGCGHFAAYAERFRKLLAQEDVAQNLQSRLDAAKLLEERRQEITQPPEALRLADELEAPVGTQSTYSAIQQAAAELRRLHAENAALTAALASSCDEQRHELWESGGVAGCERARVAERQCEALHADAERYRYLRNRNPQEILLVIGNAAGVWIDCDDENGELTLLTGEDADAAIDAAMGKT
jgi:hypothetical protein